MAWDEWEQLKQDAVHRHTARMQLDQYEAGDGPGPSTSSVTGGVKSTRREWSKAGENVDGLRKGVGKALNQLEDGQKGLGDKSGCLSAGAQKDVYDSWARYIKSVNERCGSVKEVLEKVGRDLLTTDGSVGSAFAAIAAKYADRPAVGGQGAGR
ncbi:hypothetical protein [Streptomyces kebangsaanensis]|uniref:hypothetical protein n=1 Tax=Streptomyces kebangsaanensis TaxID=864058 RepID=UPI00093A9BB9|nr:hypothetical protein [Streptomyces kebangsaanensis]